MYRVCIYLLEQKGETEYVNSITFCKGPDTVYEDVHIERFANEIISPAFVDGCICYITGRVEENRQMCILILIFYLAAEIPAVTVT